MHRFLTARTRSALSIPMLVRPSYPLPSTRRFFSNTAMKLGFEDYETFQIAAVRKEAPQFTAKAVVHGEIKPALSLSDYKGKYVVLLFYPLDFTFVCPTEIIAYSDRVEEFRRLGAEVLAISVDSVHTHLAWVNTPRKAGGLGPMQIPILSDLNKQIAKDYGVLIEEEGVALRGLFIIDGKSIVRQITINDLPVGRNVDETLRLIQALQYSDVNGEVMPCDWVPGKATIKPQNAKEYYEETNKE